MLDFASHGPRGATRLAPDRFSTMAPPTRLTPALRIARGLVPLVPTALLLASTSPLSAQGAAKRAPSPQIAPTPRYAVTTWGTEQGLPSSIVLAIQQTPDGYLWFGTYEGLVRFDGVQFHTFRDGEIPGLQRGFFPALAVDPSGVLWAGSESGELVRYERGRWKVYGPGDGMPTDPITSLALDGAGGLWIGTRSGVWHLSGGRVAPLPPPPGVEAPGVIALARAADGALWIGTVADGLIRYHQGTYQRLSTREGMPSDRIDALHADADGSIWVGFYGGRGVTRVRGAELTRFGADDPEGPRRVRYFLRDRGGTLWLAAENGLFALRGAHVEPVTLEKDRGTTKVEALFEDAGGTLWVGTRQSGLFRVREASVAVLSSEEGLPDRFAFAVMGDGAGGVWIGTQNGALHRPTLAAQPADAAGARPTVVLRDRYVRDVLRDPSGDVWIATTAGLTRLPGGSEAAARTYTSNDGLADDRARSLALGRGGALWIGTFNGVSEWRDGKLRSYGAAEGLSDGYVLSVHEDARGTLWVGTQTAGLFRREPSGRFVPGPDPLLRQPIFRIAEDADGTLWVGTSRGLARLRTSATDTTVAFVGARQGLPGSTIYQALDDGRGSLWLTGPWGIARVRRSELDAVASGRARALQAVSLGRADGLYVQEASSIGRSWRAPDGTLWFSTPAGAAVVDPARLFRPSTPPTALVEQVIADGVSTTPLPGDERALVLMPGTRTLEFRFTAPGFVSPEQLRFRYRLEGFDPEWQSSDTRRAAFYTNLPPGHYRFRVQASGGEGGWGDDTPVTAIHVHLRPHLWQTRWFLALALLATGGLVVLGYRLRMRSVARTARERVLRALALRDELTGLYNRRGLLSLMEQQVYTAERERRGFTLLFADLDGLKQINDTLSHAEGDRAIVDTAALLRESFRGADTAARLGGDEFVVLLPDPPVGSGSRADPERIASAVCTRLMQALARHNESAARPYRLALSLGTSRYEPGAPRPLEALLDDADRAMYAQKRTKRSARTRA